MMTESVRDVWLVIMNVSYLAASRGHLGQYTVFLRNYNIVTPL